MTKVLSFTSFKELFTASSTDIITVGEGLDVNGSSRLTELKARIYNFALNAIS